MTEFSVLMSVFAGERADWFGQSLESVIRQTVVPSEIVLVKDGPLSAGLECVLAKVIQECPALRVVTLPENVGLGRALAIGLEECSFDLVARMDSDDICKPERFERQSAFMDAHRDVSVLGSWVDEFVGCRGNVVGQRRLPECSPELAVYGKWRCPMNHPTVMFRKEDVLASGGYTGEYERFEDYDLWVRMITRGYRIHNLQESLVWFRNSLDVYRRRGGWAYAMRELQLHRGFVRMGYVGRWEFLVSSSARMSVRLLPEQIRRDVYRRFLRTEFGIGAH